MDLSALHGMSDTKLAEELARLPKPLAGCPQQADFQRELVTQQTKGGVTPTNTTKQ